jgi:hypothetical protein
VELAADVDYSSSPMTQRRRTDHGHPLRRALLVVALLASGCAPAASGERAARCPSKRAFFVAGPSRVALRGANVYQADRDQDDRGADFGPRLAKGDLLALRAAGANYVSFSIPGTWHVLRREPWPEMTAHLETMVRWAEEAGLFVVIAFRTGPGRGEGDIIGNGIKRRSVYADAGERAAYAAMWREVAAAYARRGVVVGYEILVEPHDVDMPTYRSFAQKIIGAIREVDAETAILVSPGDWSSAAALARFQPLEGEHLAYTVHQYEPFQYTHQAALGWTAAELDAPFARLQSVPFPVVVNEWGVDIGRKDAPAFVRDELPRLALHDHAVWLWEVADPEGYRRFDVRSSPEILAALKTAWRANTTFADACR